MFSYTKGTCIERDKMMQTSKHTQKKSSSFRQAYLTKLDIHPNYKQNAKNYSKTYTHLSHTCSEYDLVGLVNFQFVPAAHH